MSERPCKWGGCNGTVYGNQPCDRCGDGTLDRAPQPPVATPPTATPITLRCLKCRREMPYERSVDATIPAEVVVIEQTFCDQCDNGDFGTERWFDAQGREVSQDDRVYPTATPDTGEAPTHDVEVCGCEGDADYCPFNPDSANYNPALGRAREEMADIRADVLTAAPTTPPPTATLGDLLDAYGDLCAEADTATTDTRPAIAAARNAVTEYVERLTADRDEWEGLAGALRRYRDELVAELARLRSDIERLQADALTIQDAALCEIVAVNIEQKGLGGVWKSLVKQLRELADKIERRIANDKEPSGCNCGGSDEEGHKGTCPEVF